MNSTFSLQDMKVPAFRRKITICETHNDDGTLKPLVIESLDNAEFKVVRIVVAMDKIIFCIRQIEEWEDHLQDCMSIADAKKQVQFWQDVTAYDEVAVIDLIDIEVYNAILMQVTQQQFRNLVLN